MKRITGTAVIHFARYRDGAEYFAVVERPGWRCFVGHTITASSPPRYERWRVLARNKQEARKTLSYHFYSSRWRLAKGVA